MSAVIVVRVRVQGVGSGFIIQGVGARTLRSKVYNIGCGGYDLGSKESGSGFSVKFTSRHLSVMTLNAPMQWLSLRVRSLEHASLSSAANVNSGDRIFELK